MTDFKKLAADAVAAKKIKTAYNVCVEYYRTNGLVFEPMGFTPNMVECYETKWGLCVSFSGRNNYGIKYIIK